jgi:hypothetical protein
MMPIDLSIEINKQRLFTVRTFALATKRSEQNVRFLLSYGNRIRKLQVIYIAGKPMIPATELTEYPFTLPGRYSNKVYHYDQYGNIKEEA